MDKAALRALIEERTALYHKPVLTHAESVDQQKRLHKALETRKKPVNLVESEFTDYLAKLEAGNYRPTLQPSEDLYDYTGL